MIACTKPVLLSILVAFIRCASACYHLKYTWPAVSSRVIFLKIGSACPSNTCKYDERKCFIGFEAVEKPSDRLHSNLSFWFKTY